MIDVARPYDMDPATDGQLFEMLHGLFGIGDYADSDPKPWHKMRAVEIAKIKSIRAKRNLAIVDVVLLARYCSRHRIAIKATWSLLEHWPAALRERSVNVRPQLDLLIEEAAGVERGRADGGEWVDRLLRASGPGRQWVLDRWRQERPMS